MSESSCVWAKDRLPEFAGGRLDEATAGRLRAHLEACGDCAAEADLVRQLVAPVPIPVGLESRVVRAIRGRGARQRFGARQYLLAASVVFALIAGGLVWQSGSDQRGPDVAVAPVTGWSQLFDPVVNGGPGLQSLSEEELERLLKEMES